MIVTRVNFIAKAALALAIIIGLMHVPCTNAQSQPAAAKFEVASIKPCQSDGGRGGKGSAAESPSPGRLNLTCETVASLIQQAYVTFANGHRNPQSSVSISAGPAWINSDRYQIDAKAEDNASQEMMKGPMLQSLLEDRFQLQVHRETKDVPVYLATAARGGLKMPRVEESSCSAFDLAKAEAAAAARQKPVRPCGSIWFSKISAKPGLLSMDAHGSTIDAFFQNLGHILDRPVIDKTGAAGRFDFHVEFVPDETTPGFRSGGPMARFVADLAATPSDLVVGASIVNALRDQLGLKLDPGKSPGNFLVIDHVERPSAN
jgi:uncharacterized protein (TIGR03435 family)